MAKSASRIEERIPVSMEERKTYGISKETGLLTVCTAQDPLKCPYHKENSHRVYTAAQAAWFSENLAAARARMDKKKFALKRQVKKSQAQPTADIDPLFLKMNPDDGPEYRKLKQYENPNVIGEAFPEPIGAARKALRDEFYEDLYCRVRDAKHWLATAFTNETNAIMCRRFNKMVDDGAVKDASGAVVDVPKMTKFQAFTVPDGLRMHITLTTPADFGIKDGTPMKPEEVADVYADEIRRQITDYGTGERIIKNTGLSFYEMKPRLVRCGSKGNTTSWYYEMDADKAYSNGKIALQSEHQTTAIDSVKSLAGVTKHMLDGNIISDYTYGEKLAEPPRSLRFFNKEKGRYTTFRFNEHSPAVAHVEYEFVDGQKQTQPNIDFRRLADVDKALGFILRNDDPGSKPGDCPDYKTDIWYDKSIV